MNLQTLNEAEYNLLQIIKSEYEKGFLALNSLGPFTVTFYGGSLVNSSDKAYMEVYEIASRFAKKDWGIISGGGPGIMEAALKGSKSNGGKAIAFKIDLKEEPSGVDPDLILTFTQFSVRKYLLRQSDVFVFAPGGLGTLDELMEILTLIKTGKYPPKPIFLYDKEFWKGYINWFKEILLKERKVVSASFLDLFIMVDSSEEIMNVLFKD